jgi:hypothetical protein
MSLLDDASLLVTPNAEKEGKLYSIIPTNGNGDFSVTRATTATRVNAAGLVELVPYNLLQYSEQFSQGVWFKPSATISANVTTAPNGTMTADKLVGTGSNPLASQDSFTINGVTATISVYAKKAELNWLRLTNNSAAYSAAWFNLNTGTIGTISGSASPTATITNAGDGWYRCTITMLFDNTAVADIVIACTNADNTTTGYTGNGTDGIFIWGAQLVQGTAALDYQATETRLNIPRLDYSLGSCPNILLEPQRTNIALRSEEFDNIAWSKINSTITANVTTSPSGLTNADKLFPTTSSGSHFVFQAITNNQTATNTASCYFKASEYTRCGIRFNDNNTSHGNIFDLITGQVVASVGTKTTATIRNVGNGWYRCEVVITSPTLLLNFQCCVVDNNGVIFDFNGDSTKGVFLWGAQLEAGAYATSYIPTTSASVTRNADQISRGNIFANGLITASGGTWFLDLKNSIARTRDAFAQSIFIGNSSSGVGANGFAFTYAASISRIQIRKYVAAVETVIYTTTVDNPKIAIKWNGTTADIFQNGVKVVSATAFTGTNMEWLVAQAQDVPKYINSMALFPTALTDTQCIALTTL